MIKGIILLTHDSPIRNPELVLLLQSTKLTLFSLINFIEFVTLVKQS